MRNFKELIVWQKAKLLVKDIYKVSALFPSEERFGITNQIRRAVVSITCNISEGCGRRTDADFARFLDMASGSSTEVENLIYLCFDLDFINEETQSDFVLKVTEVQKMISGLNNSLSKK
jgi:four helix bundle protein